MGASPSSLSSTDLHHAVGLVCLQSFAGLEPVSQELFFRWRNVHPDFLAKPQIFQSFQHIASWISRKSFLGIAPLLVPCISSEKLRRQADAQLMRDMKSDRSPLVSRAMLCGQFIQGANFKEMLVGATIHFRDSSRLGNRKVSNSSAQMLRENQDAVRERHRETVRKGNCGFSLYLP
jgi:hypothetical protein